MARDRGRVLRADNDAIWRALDVHRLNPWFVDEVAPDAAAPCGERLTRGWLFHKRLTDRSARQADSADPR